ncbi:MAG: hypothetical protein F6J89_07505 [Symploca sp. SIO1C4]|uniref:Secreted protein n=1 Tax=Symploca sp. SIO1C4 TaxID=2607765 RepID=A0A6B3N2S3_9CYAN|nr:hypothetical protein [Symploca sp. SIO1C4]
MRNMAKFFSAIMVVTLWLSTIAAPALAVEQNTLDVSHQGEVEIVCNQPFDAQACLFFEKASCGAQLLNNNGGPAESSQWQFTLKSFSNNTQTIQQTQTDDCELIGRDVCQVEPGAKSTCVYSCVPGIAHLDILFPGKRKVVAYNLRCVDPNAL